MQADGCFSGLLQPDDCRAGGFQRLDVAWIGSECACPQAAWPYPPSHISRPLSSLEIGSDLLSPGVALVSRRVDTAARTISGHRLLFGDSRLAAPPVTDHNPHGRSLVGDVEQLAAPFSNEPRPAGVSSGGLECPLMAQDVGRLMAGFEPMRRFDELRLLGWAPTTRRPRSPLAEVVRTTLWGRIRTATGSSRLPLSLHCDDQPAEALRKCPPPGSTGYADCSPSSVLAARRTGVSNPSVKRS